ncbi:MAG TPA: hypothetical protein VGH08_07700 [Chthoniobacterales bacterium]
MQTTEALSLRSLLARSIDYAGLFPPATLKLEPALKNQANYARSNEAWMLSTFVLPVEKFAEAAWFVSEFDETYPLQISALGPKTINAIDFIEELKMAVKGIREFAGENPKAVRIGQLEMPLPADVDAAALKETATILGGLPRRAFWETSVQKARQTISMLAEHNRRAKEQQFGFKLRTGGVTADAFPASAQIAEVLVTAGKYGVPIKFTAGLHHPVRMFRDEVKTKMHGFLNVLGAGVLAIEHGWTDQQTAAMLEDEKADSFVFDDAVFRWREWEIGASEIGKHRQLITSFGSCSFDEPREDLLALNLL